MALRPDVVLASTSINREETVDALARLGLAVYTTNPQTVRGVLDSIADVADVLRASAQGQELVGQLQARLDALRDEAGGFAAGARVFRGVGESADHHRAKYIHRGCAAMGGSGVGDTVPIRTGRRSVSRKSCGCSRTTSCSRAIIPGIRESCWRELRSRQTWKGLHAVEMGHVVKIQR